MLLVAWVALSAPIADLVLTGGLVVDGTGAEAVPANIAIRAGKIVAISQNPISATREIPLGGLTVAPGFIDVHTHAENIETQPDAANFLRSGVTTLVVGNCGGSVLNVREWFGKLTKLSPAANVATLIGHNTLRRTAMKGDFNRPPTPAESESMRKLLAKGMKEGALGLSTGLEYVPGTYSKTDEVIDIARIAAKYGGIYTSHMRNEDVSVMAALDETLQVGRKANLPVHVSHLKLAAPTVWGAAPLALRKLDQARKEGQRVTQDAYTYDAYSTGLSILLPSWALEGGELKQRLADPVQGQKIRKEAETLLAAGGFKDLAWVRLTETGQSMADLGGPTLSGQFDALIDRLKTKGGSGVFTAMQETDIEAILRDPTTMCASDGSVVKPGSNVPHPRNYGNAARLLKRYVRERQVIPLGEAIRRMTSLPASTFRIEKRGSLKPGFWADLVVFDPAEVTDQATFANPHQYATGFRYVFVNGVETVRDDALTGLRGGKTLRRGKP